MTENSDTVFEVSEELVGERIDVALTRLLTDVSRARVTVWIEEGRVKLDGKVVQKPGHLLKKIGRLEVDVPEPAPSLLVPDPSVPFQILFEDEEVLVLNKPAGVVTHPGAGREEGTLVHGLFAHLGEEFLRVGHPQRPGIVHRLDKDTSGVMVVAKSEFSYHHLIRQFIPPRTISRKYNAVSLITSKFPRGGSGEVSLSIGRDLRDRKKMSVVKGGESGKVAKTRYCIVQPLKHTALFELELETGRTHQIRVHLQAIGAPILGDPVYGPPQLPQPISTAVKKMKRQALHAAEIRFLHPRTTAELFFSAPLPEDIAQLIAALRLES